MSLRRTYSKYTSCLFWQEQQPATRLPTNVRIMQLHLHLPVGPHLISRTVKGFTYVHACQNVKSLEKLVSVT